MLSLLFSLTCLPCKLIKLMSQLTSSQCSKLIQKPTHQGNQTHVGRGVNLLYWLDWQVEMWHFNHILVRITENVDFKIHLVAISVQNFADAVFVCLTQSWHNVWKRFSLVASWTALGWLELAIWPPATVESIFFTSVDHWSSSDITGLNACYIRICRLFINGCKPRWFPPKHVE